MAGPSWVENWTQVPSVGGIQRVSPTSLFGESISRGIRSVVQPKSAVELVPITAQRPGLTAPAGTGAGKEGEASYRLIPCNELLPTWNQKPQRWLLDQNCLCQRGRHRATLISSSSRTHLEDNADVLPEGVDVLEGELQGDGVGVEIGAVLHQGGKETVRKNQRFLGI